MAPLPPKSIAVRVVLFRALVALGCMLALPVGAQAQSQGDLKFFKNHFITGDYVVGGIGLRGKGTLDPATGKNLASGTISISGVPDNADIVTALLYWQSMESSPDATPAVGYFRGSALLGKQIAPANVQSCWSSGGGGGTTQGASRLRSYRANVLHLLPPHPTVPGKRVANGDHTVKVPDSGSGGSQSPSSGNQVNLAEGASLLIVYRDPSKPLRAIVIYDGGKVLNQEYRVLTHTTTGYFQASTAGANAKVTHLVGDGDGPFGEKLTLTGNGTPIEINNPFGGALGSAWDNPTNSVNIVAGATEVAAPIVSRIEATGSSVDCLTVTAIIAGVDVQDRDYDGLLDVWETSASTLANPDGQELPEINLMGANPDVQDVFIEIGFLTTPTNPSTGELLTSGGYSTPLGNVDPHTHLPSKNVLFTIATMFHNAKTAGVRKFGVTGPINLHFDVGNRYQAATDFSYSSCATPTTWTPQCSIIPGGLARGGEAIDETTILSSTAFPGFKGVIGWKSGFDSIRDRPVGMTEAACAAAAHCDRRFDENRRHIFKYALFGHALGVPRAMSNLSGTPFDDTKTPRTTSGVADGGDGGGDLLITLGFWDGFTGSEIVQTGTFAHELGHTLGLRHGGPAPTLTDTAPNCKPNYQSVMNYFFQVRGLIKPTDPATPVIDFSRQTLTTLFEKSLSETALTGEGGAAMLYSTRWYAPVTNYFSVAIGTSPSTKHCDGTDATTSMIRIDGTTTGAIDWNFSGTFGDLSPAVQDVDFNGGSGGAAPGEQLTGFNDWAYIDLRQTASRRNTNGLSLEMTLEDTGVFDWGVFDWGTLPGFGVFDWGVFDWGVFDWGVFDWGVFDWGLAEGVMDWGGQLDNTPRGDIDFLTAEAHGNPPTNVRYTAIKNGIDIFWDFPTVGKATAYKVWRAPANVPLSPTNLPVEIATISTSTTLTYRDMTTKNKVLYWYFVTATVANKQSGPSNIIQATTP